MREGAVDTGEGQGCAEEGAQPALGRDRVTTAADCRGPRATRPGNGGGDACALLPLWAPGLGTRWNRAVLLPVVMVASNNPPSSAHSVLLQGTFEAGSPGLETLAP